MVDRIVTVVGDEVVIVVVDEVVTVVVGGVVLVVVDEVHMIVVTGRLGSSEGLGMGSPVTLTSSIKFILVNRNSQSSDPDQP